MPEKRPGSGLLLLLLIIPFIYSCEFEPDKIYQRKVNENMLPPEIQAVELNLEYDTIYLYAQKQIHFKFVSNNQEILAVRFTIDDKEQFLVNSNYGEFNLDYSNFANGRHTLELEVYTASGSGSIAEHLGAEGFLFSKSWVLVIDQNYSFNLKSTISNGFLMLTWNRYRGYDFKEYVVYRDGGWNSKTEIARVHSNYFIDSSYVGEDARYDVEVINNDEIILPWGFLELEKNLPRLHLSVSGANQFTIVWNKSTYYGGVDTFNLSQSNNYGVNYFKIKATRIPDDTVHLVTTAIFGDHNNFRLRVVPKNNLRYKPGNYSLFESYLNDVSLGFPFGTKNKGVSDISQVSKDEFIYIAGCDSLVRYSVSQKHIVERFGYQPIGCTMCNFTGIKASPSGRFLTTYVDCTNNVMLSNTGNLKNNIIHNLKFLSGQLYVPEIPVSDAGIVIVNNVNGGFYLYNLNTASTISFYNKDIFTLQGLSISMNGDYVFLRHDSLRLVRFYNSQFLNIWSHSRFAEPKFYEFDGKDPERVIIWDGSTFSVKQCSDFSNIYEFPLTDGKILDIDYYNSEMLTWSTGHLYIRRFTDGSLLHDIPFNLNPTYWYNSCYLVNHAIICTQGIIYFTE